MKTILILTFAFASCGPVQDTEPAGVAQIGLLNFFRGSSSSGDVHQEDEAPAVVRSDHDEDIPATPTIETSSR